MNKKLPLLLPVLLSSCRCESVQPCSSPLDCGLDEVCSETPQGRVCTPAEGEGEGEGEPEVTIIALPSHAPVGVSFDVEFAATAAVAGPCRALVDATVVGTTALPATRVAVTLQEPGSAVTVDLDCGNAADTAQLVAWDYGAVSADSPVAAGDGSALSIACALFDLECDT